MQTGSQVGAVVTSLEHQRSEGANKNRCETCRMQLSNKLEQETCCAADMRPVPPTAAPRRSLRRSARGRPANASKIRGQQFTLHNTLATSQRRPARQPCRLVVGVLESRTPARLLQLEAFQRTQDASVVLPPAHVAPPSQCSHRRTNRRIVARSPL